MKPKTSVQIAPVNLAEQLIDIVWQNAFADMPFQSKARRTARNSNKGFDGMQKGDMGRHRWRTKNAKS